MEKGVLHISGQEFGGLVTQKEYGNYYLRAEFKWGEKMYPPRLGKSRDSGIQYNITGPLKVWARMMEFQINEGGTGDIWVVNGTGHDGRWEGLPEHCRSRAKSVHSHSPYWARAVTKHYRIS